MYQASLHLAPWCEGGKASSRVGPNCLDDPLLRVVALRCPFWPIFVGLFEGFSFMSDIPIT